jgi:hypothetical protein
LLQSWSPYISTFDSTLDFSNKTEKTTANTIVVSNTGRNIGDFAFPVKKRLASPSIVFAKSRTGTGQSWARKAMGGAFSTKLAAGGMQLLPQSERVAASHLSASQTSERVVEAARQGHVCTLHN